MEKKGRKIKTNFAWWFHLCCWAFCCCCKSCRWM